MCNMNSLKQIDDLSSQIYDKIEVNRLSKIDLSISKKILKLKEKALSSFVRLTN